MFIDSPQRDSQGIFNYQVSESKLFESPLVGKANTFKVVQTAEKLVPSLCRLSEPRRVVVQ